jgi:hypothetical protein
LGGSKKEKMKFFDTDYLNPSSILPCYGSRRANVSVESTVRIANSLTCPVGPGLVGWVKKITDSLSQSGRTAKED